jgi:hypothetical protein
MRMRFFAFDTFEVKHVVHAQLFSVWIVGSEAYF